MKKIKILQETAISCNYFHYKQSKWLFLSNPKQSFEYSINIKHDLCFQTFVLWSNAIYHFLCQFCLPYKPISRKYLKHYSVVYSASLAWISMLLKKMMWSLFIISPYQTRFLLWEFRLLQVSSFRLTLWNNTWN